MNSCSAKRVIRNHRDEAARVTESILTEAANCGFNEQACFGIRLAVDEALANAILHGNGNDPQKTIEIHYSITLHETRISITDQGRGFVPDELPDPTADENLQNASGRGVMLMQAYMTEVCFNDTGNCVTLVKHRSCTLPVRR